MSSSTSMLDRKEQAQKQRARQAERQVRKAEDRGPSAAAGASSLFGPPIQKASSSQDPMHLQISKALGDFHLAAKVVKEQKLFGVPSQPVTPITRGPPKPFPDTTTLKVEKKPLPGREGVFDKFKPEMVKPDPKPPLSSPTKDPKHRAKEKSVARKTPEPGHPRDGTSGSAPGTRKPPTTGRAGKDRPDTKPGKAHTVSPSKPVVDSLQSPRQRQGTSPAAHKRLPTKEPPNGVVNGFDNTDKKPPDTAKDKGLKLKIPNTEKPNRGELEYFVQELLEEMSLPPPWTAIDTPKKEEKFPFTFPNEANKQLFSPKSSTEEKPGAGKVRRTGSTASSGSCLLAKDLDVSSSDSEDERKPVSKPSQVANKPDSTRKLSTMTSKQSDSSESSSSDSGSGMSTDSDSDSSSSDEEKEKEEVREEESEDCKVGGARVSNREEDHNKPHDQWNLERWFPNKSDPLASIVTSGPPDNSEVKRSESDKEVEDLLSNLINSDNLSPIDSLNNAENDWKLNFGVVTPTQGIEKIARSTQSSDVKVKSKPASSSLESCMKSPTNRVSRSPRGRGSGSVGGSTPRQNEAKVKEQDRVKVKEEHVTQSKVDAHKHSRTPNRTPSRKGKSPGRGKTPPSSKPGSSTPKTKKGKQKKQYKTEEYVASSEGSSDEVEMDDSIIDVVGISSPEKDPTPKSHKTHPPVKRGRPPKNTTSSKVAKDSGKKGVSESQASEWEKCHNNNAQEGPSVDDLLQSVTTRKLLSPLPHDPPRPPAVTTTVTTTTTANSTSTSASTLATRATSLSIRAPRLSALPGLAYAQGKPSVMVHLDLALIGLSPGHPTSVKAQPVWPRPPEKSPHPAHTAHPPPPDPWPHPRGIKAETSVEEGEIREDMEEEGEEEGANGISTADTSLVKEEPVKSEEQANRSSTPSKTEVKTVKKPHSEERKRSEAVLAQIQANQKLNTDLKIPKKRKNKERDPSAQEDSGSKKARTGGESKSLSRHPGGSSSSSAERSRAGRRTPIEAGPREGPPSREGPREGPPSREGPREGKALLKHTASDTVNDRESTSHEDDRQWDRKHPRTSPPTEDDRLSTTSTTSSHLSDVNTSLSRTAAGRDRESRHRHRHKVAVTRDWDAPCNGTSSEPPVESSPGPPFNGSRSSHIVANDWAQSVLDTKNPEPHAYDRRCLPDDRHPEECHPDGSQEDSRKDKRQQEERKPTDVRQDERRQEDRHQDDSRQDSRRQDDSRQDARQQDDRPQDDSRQDARRQDDHPQDDSRQDAHRQDDRPRDDSGQDARQQDDRPQDDSRQHARRQDDRRHANRRQDDGRQEDRLLNNQEAGRRNPQHSEAWRKRRRIEPLEERLKHADFYVNEARRLKHNADQLVSRPGGETERSDGPSKPDKFSKSLMYVESVLSFIQYGSAMEAEHFDSKRIFKMYEETLKFVKHICGTTGGNRNTPCPPEAQEKDRKLTVLSLRLQAILNYKLFKIKKGDAGKLKRILDDHYSKVSKQPLQAPSPYQTAGGNPAWNRTGGTPSPMSPQPSPGGSVGSVGSVGSNGDQHLPRVMNGNVSSGSAPYTTSTGVMSTVAVPQRIHSVTQDYLTYMAYLYYSQEIWESADTITNEKHCQEFFKDLDQDCGRLWFQGSVPEIVRYIKEGLHRLKDNT